MTTLRTFLMGDWRGDSAKTRSRRFAGRYKWLRESQGNIKEDLFAAGRGP